MKFKKILAILLTAVLLVSSTVIAVPVSADNTDFVWNADTYKNMTADAGYQFSKNPTTGEYGDGTSAKPYVISTVQDLAQLACNVENAVASNYENKYFVQVNDIDLENVAWPGIGVNYDTNGSASKAFKGHYDGGNFAIKNLKIDNTYADSRVSFGLFGFVGFAAGGCQIKNINIVSGDITVDGGLCVAALIGRVRNGVKVSNCSNTVSVTVTNGIADGAYGGLLGRIEGCTWAKGYMNITNSYNGANVTVSSTATGSLYVGGICARAIAVDNTDDVTITLDNCLNYGNVSVTGGTGTVYTEGGVVGCIDKDASTKNGNATIKNATNLGNITLTSSSASSRFGGLIGRLGNPNNAINATVANCYDSSVLTVRGYSNEFWYMGSVGEIRSNVTIDQTTTKENYSSNKGYWFKEATATIDTATPDKTWTNKRVGTDSTNGSLVNASFTQNNEKKKIDLAQLSLLSVRGMQTKTNEKGEFCVRFVAELNSETFVGMVDAGVEVTYTENGGAEKNATLSCNNMLWSSLLALSDTGITKITPQGYGSLIACGISGVPAGETSSVTFKFKPYVTFEDGTTVYGAEQGTFTFVNGVQQ